MKQCPVCNKLIKNKNQRLCKNCGWEFKFTKTGKPIPDTNLIKKQIAIIKRNRNAVISLAKSVTDLVNQKKILAEEIEKLNRKIQKQIELEKIEEDQKKIQSKELKKSEQTNQEVPEHLIKSFFETSEEFSKKIDNIGTIEAGSVRLLKKKYNKENGMLPLRVILEKWVKSLDGIPRTSVDFYIIANEELANQLFETGAKYQLYAKLKSVDDKAVVDQLEINALDKMYPIKMNWQDPETGIEFIWIPAGKFMMGSPDNEKHRYGNESPLHEVILDGFWMSKYTVTQGQWKFVMGYNKSNFKLGNNYPVERVSWIDSLEFIEKLNKLTDNQNNFNFPTEAQWEYACRAGTKSPYSFGDTYTAEDGNYKDTKGCTTQVGTYPPNGFGLYDMHGNVWEWCIDTYIDNAYEKHSLKNPVCIEAGTNKVIRGGCWYRDPEFMRSAYRYGYSKDLRSGTIGLRLIK